MNPQCGCNPGPVTIYAHSTRPDLNNNIFPDGVVLTYGPTPPEFAPLSLEEFSYLSDGTYTEPTTGHEFRVLLICNGVSYSWNRAFPEYPPGGPASDQRYTWLPGNSGNPCEPFYQLNGTMFPGGDTAGKVYLSAIDGAWKIGLKSVRVRAYHPSFPTPLAGATVDIDGQTKLTGADGEVYFFITQSAVNIPWAVSKAGLVTQTGNVPGATPVATEVQFYQFSATLP